MKTIAWIATALALSLSLAGCNTWSGVKAAGKGIEKAGEKVQDIAK